MKPHILVIDDEAPIRQLLVAFFGKHSCRVTAASNGPAALKTLDETPVDMTILDMDLDGDDGLVLLEKIKTAHPRLPVLMLTGMGFDEELLQEALRKGASGYVSKTLSLDQLLSEVRRILKSPQTAA